MKRILVTGLSALTVLGAGLVLVSCGGGSSGGGVVGSILNASLKNSQQADLTGQRSVFTGTLGSGVTFTFPAAKGGNYLIALDTTDPADTVEFEVIGDDGSALNAKSVDSGNGFIYNHQGQSQHVLVIARPYNPFDTDIGVTSMTVTGTGTFPNDQVRVNFVIAGKFTGLGINNDLTTSADQGAFTDAVMARVQTLFQQTGITISYEGFAYDAQQVSAQQPGLIGPDDQALCAAGESVGATGFEMVATQGLDQWGELGFAETDPNFDRGHGINVFLIHHFTNDGTVGLSPRPGVLVGKGPDTALCVAAFLQDQGSFIPRTVDEVATVLAHEIGHFLGLLHTTTFNPDPLNPSEAIDDGVLDTPECTSTTDTNGDGRIGLGDGCPDESNLMFYQAGAQTLFTQGQSDIMKNLLSAQEH